MKKSMSRPRVLVTGAGGPAGVAVIRSLAQSCDCFAVDIDPCAVGLYLVEPERSALVPRGDDPRFMGAVSEICVRWSIDVFVPTVDTELLPAALAAPELRRSIGLETVVGPAAALSICLDKWLLAQSLPPELRPPGTELLAEPTLQPRHREWPAVTKPRRGSGSRGVRILDGPEELASVPADGTMLLQDYLPGEELSVDVYVDQDANFVGGVARSRLKVDSGVAVAGRTVRCPEALELAEAVVVAIGLTGPANVQCKRNRAGGWSLLEVNPRFSGSLPLTIAAGFDTPLLALGEALGVTPEPLRSFDEIAIVRYLDDVILDADAIANMTKSEHPPNRNVAA